MKRIIKNGKLYSVTNEFAKKLEEDKSFLLKEDKLQQEEEIIKQFLSQLHFNFFKFWDKYESLRSSESASERISLIDNINYYFIRYMESIRYEFINNAELKENLGKLYNGLLNLNKVINNPYNTDAYTNKKVFLITIDRKYLEEYIDDGRTRLKVAREVHDIYFSHQWWNDASIIMNMVYQILEKNMFYSETNIDPSIIKNIQERVENINVLTDFFNICSGFDPTSNFIKTLVKEIIEQEYPNGYKSHKQQSKSEDEKSEAQDKAPEEQPAEEKELKKDKEEKSKEDNEEPTEEKAEENKEDDDIKKYKSFLEALEDRFYSVGLFYGIHYVFMTKNNYTPNGVVYSRGKEAKLYQKISSIGKKLNNVFLQSIVKNTSFYNKEKDYTNLFMDGRYVVVLSLTNESNNIVNDILTSDVYIRNDFNISRRYMPTIRGIKYFQYNVDDKDTGETICLVGSMKYFDVVKNFFGEENIRKVINSIKKLFKNDKKGW